MVASSRKGTDSTRQRLLAAACQVFSEKALPDATIAEICERAKANIASVNYHFHDKESLYVEAWRHSFAESIATHPPEGGVPDNAPAADRLRGRILALLQRIADVASAEVAIMHRELANPTGLLSEVVRDAIGPLRAKMHDLMRELLGPDATDDRVELCAMSTISQCMGLIHRKRMGHSRIAQWLRQPGGVEALADHITAFSLAGARAIAEHGAALPRTNDTEGGWWPVQATRRPAPKARR